MEYRASHGHRHVTRECVSSRVPGSYLASSPQRVELKECALVIESSCLARRLHLNGLNRISLSRRYRGLPNHSMVTTTPLGSTVRNIPGEIEVCALQSESAMKYCQRQNLPLT